MTSKAANFPIVGIGASAGGIPALESFFKGLDCDCGAAFVIVTHLSPDRESLLHEVVSRYTAMPVIVAQDGAKVEPRKVYVLPHNAILSIKDGALQVRKPNALSRERKPIDIFFSALAQDLKELAVGIVLSGGDSDGTLGVKAIKERGGLTMAQVPDGDGPRNPDMPQSAITSGFVDFPVPADQMGTKLAEFVRSFDLLDGLANGNGAREIAKAQGTISDLLRKQSGHDFSGYKSKTFMRRVQRRMHVNQTDTLAGYIEQLKRDPAEVGHLFRDLLINVTNFFRDADAFQALEKMVIPRIFEGKGADDTVRVWIPGCSTGEEVYSIGILLREQMERLSTVPRVQIFATDIDEPGLLVARAARYPETLLEGISEERKRRFFTSDGSSYTITKEVRELCIFSPHSVIREPPFSRMDLVSCRNLLIYFGPDIQKQVIPTFHYSLKPGGYLFLGTSESLSQHSALFAEVDKKHRIFASRDHAAAPPRLPVALSQAPIIPFSRDLHAQQSRPASYPLRQSVEAHVLEHFAPPHVVVNAEGDIVFYSARTGKYLEPSKGAPSRQLLTMGRKGLRLDLRSALREAVETRRSALRANVTLDEDDGHVQMINLLVAPLEHHGGGEQLYVVVFEPLGPAQSRDEAEQKIHGDTHEAVTELERELRDTRERLQSTIEEYETALEELKASNEELVSLNEEAQSTNEELEASKEEMQSLNEELNTINAELNDKIAQLDQANSDLKNLFESTEIASVFLDRNLVIRNFTPTASTFFNLLPGDLGRPLTDLASQLDHSDLKSHIRTVFESGDMIEHRVSRDNEGKHYLVRMNPYRNGDDQIEGVVVTFVDVTTLAESEEHKQVLIAELNHRVKNMLMVVIAIAEQTLMRTPDPKAFTQALVGRLNSMARAYTLLSEESWTSLGVRELIGEQTEPFGNERVSAQGPDVSLKPEQALAIGMVLHELVTNAVKYGALSNSKGRVEMEWSLSSDSCFRLEWREQGGPYVSAPDKDGFGLKLLRGEIEYRLDGKVSAEFKPDGLIVVLEFQLD